MYVIVAGLSSFFLIYAILIQIKQLKIQMKK